MIVSGFYIKKDKSMLMSKFNIIYLLFVGTLSFDLWYILTASGLELSGGKDVFSFLDSVKLNGENFGFRI